MYLSESEEESSVEVETSEESSTTVESGEEYFAEEVIEVKELSINDIDITIRKAEVLEKASRGEIPVDQAVKIINEINASYAIPVEQPRRRRRRKGS